MPVGTNSKTTYSQGYHKSVTAAHAQRTAEADGSFVLPYLKPNFKILDVGCGPGTISIGFAKYVPQGSVTGIDLSENVLSQARAQLEKHENPPRNITFELGNAVEELKYADDTFDVVFTNQVLIHIPVPDPVTALREIRRVLKPGGIACCRESDLPYRFYPFTRGMQLFSKYLYEYIHVRSTSLDQPSNPPHPEGTRTGSLVHVWGREAGFEPRMMVKGASATVFASEEERRAWGVPMLARIEEGGTGEGFKARGATEEEVREIVGGLREWMADVDGWFGLFQCEVVMRK